jgi:diketogulonate reductase-like aldo/keto reductase
VDIASGYGKSPAQILIRWALQRDFVVLPKSTNERRMAENASVFDFEINDDDMARLDGLDGRWVSSWDPTDAP